jgi:beta-galactosidase
MQIARVPLGGVVLMGMLFGLGISAKSPRSQAAGQPAQSSLRIILDFDSDWHFLKGDFATASMPQFDDSSWRRLRVPHDWSIEGPLSADLGSGNGYAPGGIGWYRKRFKIDPTHNNKLVFVEFDGIYDHSQIWINGHYAGGRPYGYSSFQCNLTPYLKSGGADNVIAVRVDHSRFADSRWYTGSGIYRHVRLIITDRLHITRWGTFVTTPDVGTASATVRVETEIENGYAEDRAFSLHTEIVAPDGRVSGSADTRAIAGAGGRQNLVQLISVPAPQLWSIASPSLYTVRSRIGNDDMNTSFGIRAISFDPDKGFFLNGNSLKLKGVCIHHDAGCLGAAVPDQVLERRLRRLKELGVNAIRTAHNPPAPELLDLCDRIGLLVKDEAFDEFTPAKNKWVSGRNVGVPSRFGYAEMFAEWSVTDMEDLVRRDRNHPSVIMWSVGNEIDYPNDPFSHPVLGKSYRPENPHAENLVKYAKPLVQAVRRLDPTRPVTAGLAHLEMSDAVGLGELLDIVGYNYQESRYLADHQKYPKRFIFGSETSHQYNNWTVVRDNAYVAGQFLWTGIDYLGEANRWPNHGSNAGLLDSCAFKKPNAWFRQSLWSESPMVFIMAALSEGAGGRAGSVRGEDSWNWPAGSTVNVTCYTNCAEVRLTLNDRPVQSRRSTEAVNGALSFTVPYEPGVLKAVGMNNGMKACEYVLQTAGAASKLELYPDTTVLRANGKDICHVEFRIADDRGVRIPDAGDEVAFEIQGPAEVLGIDNGDLNSTDNYQDLKHRAFHGRGLVIIQAGSDTGNIVLKATATLGGRSASTSCSIAAVAR